MPRKGHIAKRTVAADAVYGSDLVTKFINSMMWQGKRSTAEGIFYEALERVQEKGGDEALKLFKKAVENRWLISYARARGEKGMVDKLSNELLDAATGKGAAIKKKEDVHRMAEANKAFAHYRW
jgi:small subunit ribosomal protein S7